MKIILKIIADKRINLVYLLLTAVMLLSALISVACSQIMIYIVDLLTESMLIMQLFYGLSIYFGVSVFQAWMSWLQTVLTVYLNEQAEMKIRQNIMSRLFDKSLSFFVEKKAGDIQQLLISDVVRVVSFITDTLLSVVSNAITAFAVIIYLAYLQWDLLLVVLLLQPCMIIVQSGFAKKVYKYSEEYRESIGKSVSYSLEIINNIIQCVGFGLRNFCLNNYHTIQEENAKRATKSANIKAMSTTGTSVISLIIFVLVFGMGGYKVSKGVMTFGMLIAFIQFSQNLLEPFLQLFSIKIEYEQVKPSLNRIVEITAENEGGYGKRTSGICGKIEIKNVTFSYEDKVPVLKNLSATFNSGKTYCIAGKSGKGKTTICNLILRLCQPQKGEILIGGISVNSFDEAYLYQNITYIAQVPFIFNGTIKDNICLNLKDLADDVFWDAVRFSGLEEDINKFPLKESHCIGDCGANLSVGQRQRIGIARAYVRNAPIVIFDEPTASIGQEYTDWYIKQMDYFKKDRLVIIISHDEKVVNACDVVYKLTEISRL